MLNENKKKTKKENLLLLLLQNEWQAGKLVKNNEHSQLMLYDVQLFV